MAKKPTKKNKTRTSGNQHQKKKRKLKPNVRRKTAKGKKFLSPKLKVLLAILGAASLALISNTITTNKNTYTVAKVQDMEDDEFEDSIPLYSNGELLSTIEDNQFVIVNTDADVEKGSYEIMTIGPDGELITGVTDSEYVDVAHGLKLKADDDRLKYSYKVTGTEVVNLRNSTVLDTSSKIGTVKEGEYVIGGDRIVSKDNDFMWVPVIYIDEEGNLAKAYMCQDYLEMVDEISLVDESRVAKTMKVNTERHNGVDLHLRSETVIDDSTIVTNIPNGSIVTKLPEADKNDGSYKWSKIEYIDPDGNTYEGWVVNGFLEDVELIKMRVDTSKDGKINLNVRKEPSISSDKVASIEHDTKIEIPQDYIDQRIHEDESGKDWVRIELSDGTHGYVDYSYLQREKAKDEKSIEAEGVISQDELEDIFDRMSVRSTGNVVGIDTTSYTPDKLRDVLKSKDAIPSTVYYWGEDEYDTSDLAGKVDFVMIRVGARGWGEAGNMVDCGDDYKKYAEVCEECKVPYGFYYYSTALTKEEADQEIEYCKHAINSLDSRKYNLLPLTADFETHIKRQNGEIVEQSRLIGHDVTEVASYWANTAEKDFGKIMIYTSARNMTPGNYEYIINLQELNKQVLSGKPKFWIAGLRYPDDYTQIQGHEYLDPLRDDMALVMTQTILDSDNDNTGLPRTDIDIIKEKDFIELLKNRRKELIHDYTQTGSRGANEAVASIENIKNSDHLI